MSSEKDRVLIDMLQMMVVQMESCDCMKCHLVRSALVSAVNLYSCTETTQLVAAVADGEDMPKELLEKMHIIFDIAESAAERISNESQSLISEAAAFLEKNHADKVRITASEIGEGTTHYEVAVKDEPAAKKGASSAIDRAGFTVIPGGKTVH